MGLSEIGTWLSNDGVKAVLGAAGLAGVSWAFGRFNSAMKVTSAISRQPSLTVVGHDELVLSLTLEKQPPTRVRLTGIELHSSTLNATELANVKSQFELAFDRLALVAGDSVTFHGHFTAKSDSVIQLRFKLCTAQLLFESIPGPKPFWTGSVVSLPIIEKTKKTE